MCFFGVKLEIVEDVDCVLSLVISVVICYWMGYFEIDVYVVGVLIGLYFYLEMVVVF